MMSEPQQAISDRVSRPIRVAMLPPLFNPVLTYQENVCAAALHRAGFEVRVFTSWHGVKELPGGGVVGPEVPFPVRRARRVLKFRDSQLPLDSAIVKELREFAPDVALVMAPLHGLGWAWMKVLPADCRVGAFFSDIPWHREKSWFRTWLKRKMARQIFRRAERVFAATPQTTALLNLWGGDLLGSKLETPGLTLDFSTLQPGTPLPGSVLALRQRVSRLVVMVTRVTREKALHQFFSQIERYLISEQSDGCVIAGLGEDKPAQLLRTAVEVSSVKDRVLLLPTLDSHQIGSLFRESDFSLWNSVSIGMYQSLACGSPVVLYSGRGSAEHLVKEGINGLWFHNHEAAPEVMARAREIQWDKSIISQSVASAAADKVYPALVQRLLGR
jgi:glycosyltransferase involved in cell wall biosynthesis